MPSAPLCAPPHTPLALRSCRSWTCPHACGARAACVCMHRQCGSAHGPAREVTVYCKLVNRDSLTRADRHVMLVFSTCLAHSESRSQNTNHIGYILPCSTHCTYSNVPKELSTCSLVQFTLLNMDIWHTFNQPSNPAVDHVNFGT